MTDPEFDKLVIEVERLLSGYKNGTKEMSQGNKQTLLFHASFCLTTTLPMPHGLKEWPMNDAFNDFKDFMKNPRLCHTVSFSDRDNNAFLKSIIYLFGNDGNTISKLEPSIIAEARKLASVYWTERSFFRQGPLILNGFVCPMFDSKADVDKIIEQVCTEANAVHDFRDTSASLSNSQNMMGKNMFAQNSHNNGVFGGSQQPGRQNAFNTGIYSHSQSQVREGGFTNNLFRMGLNACYKILYNMYFSHPFERANLGMAILLANIPLIAAGIPLVVPFIDEQDNSHNMFISIMNTHDEKTIKKYILNKILQRCKNFNFILNV